MGRFVRSRENIRANIISVCLAAGTFWLVLVAEIAAPAQSFTTIKSLGNISNVTGMYPDSPLVQGPDGTLYGTAAGGEPAVRGTVFKIQPDGSGFAVLKMFTELTEGAGLSGGLFLEGNTLYGTAARGGQSDAGTVFKLLTDGSGYTVIKHLGGGNGSDPRAALIFSAGTLYGTAYSGGGSGSGTVFKVNTDGSAFTVLKSFSGDSDGANPRARLLLNGSTLYGTTEKGGTSGLGTVFKVNTDGTGFAVMHNFVTGFGEGPQSGLVLGGNALYGVTPIDGQVGWGMLYELNTDGSGFTVIKRFPGYPGARPTGDLLMDGDTLYGTTDSGGLEDYEEMIYYGTVFRVNTDGSGYAALLDPTDGPYQGNIGAGLARNVSTLFGVSYNGGGRAGGSVFKVNTDGNGYSVLKSFAFSDAAYPYGGVVLDGGTLYGATYAGGGFGRGGVFRVDSDGRNYRVLHSFDNESGSRSYSGLVVDGGALYGTTQVGGGGGYGAVFKVNTDGTGYSELSSFHGANGAFPQSGFVLGGNTLYGTTRGGGESWNGVIYKVNTDGSSHTVLKEFPASEGIGLYPEARLVLSGSTLYGTAPQGGAANGGTVFKLNTDGTGFSVLKHFTGAEARYPSGDLTLQGSTLYGTTTGGGSAGWGTVFKMSTDGSQFVVLKHFQGGSDGWAPRGSLVLAGDTLYGTTSRGGAANYGTLFSLKTDGNAFAVLRHFAHHDGASPRGDLALSGSFLYGATEQGGDLGIGTVFAIDLAAMAQPIVGTGSFAEGRFRFNVNGPTGPDYAVQASSNLVSGGWITIFRTNSPIMPFTFTDADSVAPRQFYRVITGSPLP